MDSTHPDREERMLAEALEETIAPPAYQIEEDGKDLVIRIPASVMTRERLERFLEWIHFESLKSRSRLTETDAAELGREVKQAVRERLNAYTGSVSSSAVAAGEKADELAPGRTGEAGMDDPLENLYFMSRVERGIRQIDAGRFVPHEEAKRRFGR